MPPAPHLCGLNAHVYADYDQAYDAGKSVDGMADTWDAGVLRGSFNQLKKLKAKHCGTSSAAPQSLLSAWTCSRCQRKTSSTNTFATA